MKIILHIGMGKTGTSAIQRALNRNGPALAGARMAYLGMWFDLIDPAYKGLGAQKLFFALTEDEMAAAADLFVDRLTARTQAEGIETFVLSNESLCGKAEELSPFIDRLLERGVDLRILAYLRNAHGWLPSAYGQWGLRHKIGAGRIQPYPAAARLLVKRYGGALEWHDRRSALLELRSYDRAGDIVVDFGQAIGAALEPLDQRVLESAEPVEMLMRARFNDRIDQPALPTLFDKAVQPSLSDIPRIEDLTSAYFDYSATPAVIAEEKALFDQIEAASGLDLTTPPERPRGQPDAGQMRDRVLDVLLQVVLQQAGRIRQLDARLAALEETSKPETR